MDSLIWEESSFSRKNKEIFRRQDILYSFLWAVLNLIGALWLSALLNPGYAIKHYPNVSVRFIVLQVVVGVLLCIILVSAIRHIYLLCVTLNLFGLKKTEGDLGSAGEKSIREDHLGPSVFRQPLSCFHSFGSCSSSPILSVSRNVNESVLEHNLSWCPDRFSPLMQPYGSSSPNHLSLSSTQTAANSSIKSTPAAVFNFSPRHPNQSWSPSLASPLTTPSSRRASTAPLWCTYSPATPPVSTSPSSNPASKIAAILPLQYQLATPLSSVSGGGGGGYVDIGNSFGKSPASSPSSTQKSDADEPRVDDDDSVFGRLVRQGQKGINAPEKKAAEYWKANNVTEFDLERWTVDIRRWLHVTILRRVVDEIASANAKIAMISEDAPLIGSTTLNTLERLAKGRYQHISALPLLIKFLELTKEQSYLVYRLQELGRGSCLGEFRWDGGSRSTAFPWKDYLPNDTLILLHLFSTYMDSLFPPHAKCLSDGVFGQLHLVRSPDKPDLKSKYNAQIYVSAVQPPVIKIVIDGVIYAFPQDRFNLYHALLMFFHFYKSLDGAIRSISLGPSGLNIAWIFERR